MRPSAPPWPADPTGNALGLCLHRRGRAFHLLDRFRYQGAGLGNLRLDLGDRVLDPVLTLDQRLQQRGQVGFVERQPAAALGDFPLQPKGIGPEPLGQCFKTGEKLLALLKLPAVLAK